MKITFTQLIGVPTVDYPRKPITFIPRRIGRVSKPSRQFSLDRFDVSPIIAEVLSRMKDLELAGPFQRVRSTLMNGVRSMPVRFTPAAVRI